MKSYSFTKIAAREYPTLHLLDNPYIWGGVQFCVNLSERPYSPELTKALKCKGIEWIHCPISEDDDADWLKALATALPKMYLAHKAGKKQVVHCDFGNNRSCSFVEALYYALEHKEYDDPYKGYENHLIYNCKSGHLPEIDDLEHRIRLMCGLFPAWSTPSEEHMRRSILSSKIDGHRERKSNKKMSVFENPTVAPECGTPFLNALYRAEVNFRKGQPIEDGVIIDEVEMTVFNDWKEVGTMWETDGTESRIITPRYAVAGEDVCEYMMTPDEIDGFLPVSGHEYKLLVRRFRIKGNTFYHTFELIQLLEDTKVAANPIKE